MRALPRKWLPMLSRGSTQKETVDGVEEAPLEVAKKLRRHPPLGTASPANDGGNGHHNKRLSSWVDIFLDEGIFDRDDVFGKGVKRVGSIPVDLSRLLEGRSGDALLCGPSRLIRPPMWVSEALLPTDGDGSPTVGGGGRPLGPSPSLGPGTLPPLAEGSSQEGALRRSSMVSNQRGGERKMSKPHSGAFLRHCASCRSELAQLRDTVRAK